jgi:hypothetical protein
MNTDLLREHAYLVERGVRAIALAGACPVADVADVTNALAIEGAYSPGAVPFILPKGDGLADYGYGASRWAIDLYRWAMTPEVPTIHRERIVGLLLGYSTDAIERFETRLPVGLLADQGVVDGPMTMRARRQHLARPHVDRPVATVRGVLARLWRSLAGSGHLVHPFAAAGRDDRGRV